MSRLLRLWCCLLALLASAVPAFAQATITTIAPTSALDGSSDFTLTLTGTAFPTFGPRNDGVCFYTGFNNTRAIVPSVASGTSATLTVPAASLSSVPPSSFTGGTFTASVYIASSLTTCSGANNISNIKPFTINLSAITIASPSPAVIGEGAGAFTMVLNGTLPPLSSTTNGICFYTTANGGLTPLIPSSSSGTTATVSVPANYTSTIPSGSYVNGEFAAQVFIAPATGNCSPAVAESNNATVEVTNFAVAQVSPATINAGAQTATTVQLTGSFPTFSSSTFGVCFYYADAPSLTPLMPTTASGSSATLSVPASLIQGVSQTDFGEQGVATVQIFVAPAGQNCNPSLPDSNISTFNVFQYLFEIGSSTDIPAGQAGFTFTLVPQEGGTLPSFSSTTIGVCFYTSFSPTTPLIPTVVNGFETVNIPASYIQALTPASYTAGYGQITGNIFLAQAGQTCNPNATTNYSTFGYVYLTEPETYIRSFLALSQNNPALSASANPTQVQLQGYDFASGSVSQAQFTYSVGSTALPEVPGTTTYIDINDATSTLPAPPAGATDIESAVCNVATYTYCGGFLDPAVYPLATSTSTLTAAPSTLYTTQTTSLTASYVPGTFSTPTSGAEGALSGTVTFTQGSTNLGTAPLVLNTATATFKAGDPTSIGDTYSEGSFSNLTFYNADFNKDGIPDLVILDTTSDSLHLLLGTPPRGDYLQMNDLPTAGSCSASGGTLLAAAVGDLNGDGYPDLVYLCRPPVGEFIPPPVLYVALNTGGIVTATPTMIGTVTATQVAIADVNKDGKADIVLSGQIGTNPATGAAIYGFATYLGNGSGSTFTAGPTTTSVYGQNGKNLTLVDYDHDGYPDVAVLNTATPIGIVLLRNDHTGAFGAATATVTTTSTSVGFVIEPLSTGTLYPSVLVTDIANTRVGISVNPGTGAFTAPALTYTSIGGLTSTAWGDFNNDGNLDLAVDASAVFAVRLGNGTATLAAANSITSGYVPAATLLPLGIDQNGDGYADVLSYVPPSSSGSSGTLTNYMVSGTTTATLNNVSLPAGNPTVVTATTPGTVEMLGGSPIANVTVTGPPAPTINWANPAAITYGTLLSATQLNATATNALGAMVAGTFTYTPAANTLLTAGTQTLSVLFTPTDAIDYSSATKSVMIVVNQATPTVSWTMPAPIAYGTALSATQLDATATGISGALAGTFVYTPAVGAILNPGNQPLAVVFTPTDITDYKNGAGATTIVVTAPPSTYVAPTTPVASTSATQTAYVNFTTAGKVGSVNVLTQGAANLDYKLVAGGTCTVGTTYAVGAACSVMYSFTPSTPGNRLGGITLTLTNAAGAVLGGSYLSGIGTGPLVTFPANDTQILVNNSPKLAQGLAMDGSGNLFVADSAASAVKELTFASSYATATTVGSGFSAPQSVAVDGLGNVFVADSSSGKVSELAAAGGYTTVTSVGSGLAQPQGVAIDGSGNLYVTDIKNINVKKFTQASGYATATVLGSGFTKPYGIAVDGSANVFVADNGSNSVKEITAASGYVTVNTLGSGITAPKGVTLDAEGDIFVTGSAVQEILAASGYTTVNTLLSSASNGAVVDPKGNLFFTTGSVDEVAFATPQTLTFPSTQIATTSAAQSVTVANEGNATLAFSALTSTNAANFPFSGSTCTATGTLAMGATCTVDVAFSPQSAGTITGNANATDNTLNAPGTVQSIPLSGLGALGTKTITFPQPTTPVALGATATLTATTSNGDPVTYSITGGTAALSGNGITYTNAGTVTITANSTATSTYAAATPVSVMVTVQKGTPTITWNPNPSTIASGTALSGAQLDATAAYNGVNVPGNFVYNPASGAVLAPGPQTLNATFTPADTTDYNGATGTAFITVTASGSNTAPTTPVGSTSATQTVTLTFNTAGTLGAINVLTQGTLNLDYKLVAGGTCAVGTAYAVNQPCTVMYAFAPTTPGTRLGGITLTTGAGGLLGSTYLVGLATGPLVTFPSNTTPALVDGGLNNAEGLALDGSGNVFLADYSGAVYELQASNGYSLASVGTGFTAAFGIAVDGIGNLFVADTGAGQVDEVFASSGYTTQTAIGTGVSKPAGVAVDGKGNVYVADLGLKNVRQFTAASGYTTPTTIGSGFTAPAGIAVDGSGNVFVADKTLSKIFEVTAASGYTTVNTLGSGFNGPTGVMVDDIGNVFVADGNAIKEILAAGGYTTVNTLATGFDGPGLGLDPAGNLFFTTGGTTVYRFKFGTAPTLTFPSTTIPATSAVQTVSVANEGNTSLVFTGLANTNPTNFPQSGSTCTGTSTLTSGASCAIGLDFSPQSTGTISGFVNLTDNTLNATGTIQGISMSGIGVAGAKTITFPTLPTPVALDATATLTASASNGDPVTYSITAGTASLIGSTVTYTHAGMVTITASSAATSTYAAATQVSQTIVVQQGTPTMSWTPNPATIPSGTALSAAQLDATASYNGVNVPGSFVYNPALGAVLSPGSQTLNVSFTPTDTADYTTATSTASIYVTAGNSYTAPTTPVGTTSSVQTADVTITTAGTLGIINVLTQGAANLDYKLISGGTCTVSTAYSVNQVCSVMYSFTPTVPGERLGGITVTTAAGALLGASYLNGIGTGPQATFPGNTAATTLNSSFSEAGALAKDGNGNLFVSDDTTGVVKELTAASNYATALLIKSGLNNPQAVAVDGFGNLFVANLTGAVDELLAAGGYATTVAVGPSPTDGLANAGVAVDTNGNLYISRYGSGPLGASQSAIERYTSASGYATSSATTLGSGFNTPAGLAVDASANVFVADYGNNAIKQITAASGYTTVNTLGSNTPQPRSVSLDAAGNIFISAEFQLEEILAAGGYTTVNLLAPASFGNFLVDGNGNIFGADNGAHVFELNLSTPNPLTFASTQVGASSAAQSVALANDGNTALNFSALASSNPANFPLSGSTCTATGSLAAGAGCTIGVAFSPQTVALLTGNANATDNNLNVPGSVQSISLSGTGVLGTKTITFPQPATPVALGATATLAATTSNGDPVTYSITAGTATLSGSTITYTNAGQVTITANSAATSTYAAATPVSVSVTVQKGTPVISWTPNPATIAYGTPLSAAQLDATAAYNGVNVPGVFTYTPASGTVLSPGPQTLNVSFVPTDTVDYNNAAGTAGITVNSPGNAYTVPTTPVGSTSATQTADIQFNLNGTIASINVLTQGAPNLDYKLVSGGSCAVGTAYTVGQVCSVQYTFTPSVPGTRLGGITLTMTSSSGVVLGGSYLTGIGTGPQVTFVGNNPATTLNTVPTEAQAMAFDGSGNLFVSDSTGSAGEVRELLASTGYVTANTIGSGFVQPGGLAIDGFGNLFVADSVSRKVSKFSAAGGYSSSVSVGSGFTGPSGVAIDGSGNLYVTDGGTANAVRRFTAASGYTSSTTLGSGFNGPGAIALDSAADVFVVDQNNNAIKEITAASNYATVNTLGSGFFLPYSIAVDAAADVFVADNSTYLIKEIPSAGGYTTVNSLSNALSADADIGAIQVDGSGNLFVADDQFVYKLDFVTPPTLTFPSTTIGSASAAQSATLANDGNTALNFTALASTNPGNYLLSGSTCTATGTLAAGASCTVGVQFTPQTVGTITGDATATDNNLNAVGSVQSIPLTGSSGLNTKTITFPQPTTPVALNATATLAATASNGDPVTYSIIGGTATIVGSQITYTNGGTVTIAANSAATSTYAAAAQVTRQVVVQQATPTVTWPTPGAIVYGTALSATQLDATASVPGTFTYTPASGAVLTAGTQTLSVLFTPTDATDYAAVTQTVSLRVTIDTPVITWPAPAPLVQGTPLSATQLDATATGAGGETVAGSFTYTPPLGTVLGLGLQTLNVSFVPTDTADYNSATGSTSINIVAPSGSMAPSTPVGSTSATQTAPLTFTSPGTLGSINVLTQGAPNLDYKLVTGGTCAVGTAYTSGQSCTVLYTFTPAFPGSRLGGITLTNASGAMLAGGYLAGIGTGPQVTFPSNSLPSTFAAGFTSALAVAQDGNNNLFVTDATGTLTELLASTNYTTSSPVANGFIAPYGIALDGFGNLFVADAGKGAVDFLSAASGYQTVTSVGNGFEQPGGVAVDGAGDLYVSDFGTQTVFKFTAASGYTQSTTLGSGFLVPAGIAVDLNSNVFVADAQANAVKEITAASGYTTVTTLGGDGSTLTNPRAVAVDAAGNVFVTDVDDFTIREILAVGGYTTVNTIATSAAVPALAGEQGLLIDGSGNLLLGAGTSVLKLDYSTPPSLTFPSTAVGSASPVQNVTVANDGNTTLTFTGLALSNTNFAFNDSSCSAAGTLAAGTSCTIGIDFTPPVYTALTGTATLTDNTRNAAGAMQSIALSGGGLADTKTITFPQPASPVARNASATLAATASNGDPVTYSILSGTATLSGSTITYTTAGPVVIAANSAATSTYSAAPQVTRTVQVLQTGSMVTWTPNPATITYGTALSSAQLDATATIPGAFVYTPAAGAVLAAGNQTLSVLFTPTDMVNYSPVTQTASLLVTKATPTVNWANPAGIVQGTALSATQLNATASVPGAFVYTPAAGTVLAAGNQTLSVLFTPTDAADYNTVTQTVALVVTKATPTVTWTTPASIAYGTALSAAQLNATASVPGTFVYTPAAGTVLGAGTQILSVLFTPTDAVDYNPVTQTVSLVVTKTTPTVTWSSPASIVQGTALSATQLNATASVPGTFVYTPAAGTVLTAGTQTLSVLFTPTDTADYNTATRTVSLVVTQATTAVTWTTPAPITYGTALSSTQLNATATIPGTFVYTPAAGTVLGAGARTLSVVFTPTDSVDYSVVTQTVSLLVNKATPTVTWASPASIVQGTALSAAQLNATSSVPGAFVYTPAAGIVLGAGTQTLSVLFTPTDAADYNTVTQTVSLVVTKATPIVTWTTPASIAYGTALSAAQLNATASVPGAFVYTPAAGTVPLPGTQTLSVLFTPTDATDYTTATQTVSLVVNIPTTSAGLTSTANPSQFGQQITLSLAITPSAALTAAPTGTVTFKDGATTLGTANLSNNLATFQTSTLLAASHALTAVYSGDTNYVGSTSPILTQVVSPATTTVAWTPAVASIVYGTALSAAQLNATVSTPYATTVAGVFTYTPASGSVLTAGTQTLRVTFTPTDTADFQTATGSTSITVTQATPILTWPTPAGLVVGTALTSTQLDATAAGVTGAALPGAFVYTPPAGTLVTGGAQTLSVTFTPADATDYTSASAMVSLNGTPLALTSLSSTTALLGDPAKTVTLTGAGFLPTSVVQLAGSAIPATYVNPTTITVVIPASDFLVVATLPVTVSDPAQNSVSSAINISVTAPPVSITFSSPGTVTPAQQPTVPLQLINPYPVVLTGVVTLTFTPQGTGPNDPSIQFAQGGRTLTFQVQPGSTITPTIQFQTGTVAGTITLTLTLTAGGANVTPASVQPITVPLPQAIPAISAVSFVQSGNSILVSVTGYSNTLQVATANFHFTAANGSALANPDVSIPVTTLFAPYYSSTASAPYGSEFVYTQFFTLSESETIGSVSVTLVNSVGTSSSTSSQ